MRPGGTGCCLGAVRLYLTAGSTFYLKGVDTEVSHIPDMSILLGYRIMRAEQGGKARHAMRCSFPNGLVESHSIFVNLHMFRPPCSVGIYRIQASSHRL